MAKILSIIIVLIIAFNAMSFAEYLKMFEVMEDGREVLRETTVSINYSLPSRTPLWTSVLGSGTNSIKMDDIYSAIAYLDKYNLPAKIGIAGIEAEDKQCNETFDNVPGQALEKIYNAIIPHLLNKFSHELELLENNSSQYEVNCTKYHEIKDLYQYSYLHLIVEEWQTMDVVIWFTRNIVYWDNTYLQKTEKPYEALEKLREAIKAYKRRVKDYLDYAENRNQTGIPKKYQRCDTSLLSGKSRKLLIQVRVRFEDNWVKIGAGLDDHIPKYRSPVEDLYQT